MKNKEIVFKMTWPNGDFKVYTAEEFKEYFGDIFNSPEEATVEKINEGMNEFVSEIEVFLYDSYNRFYKNLSYKE